MADFGTSFTDAFIGMQKLGLQRRQMAAEEARANAAEARASAEFEWQKEAHDRANKVLTAFANVNQYDVKPDAQGGITADEFNARFTPPSKTATPQVKGRVEAAPEKPKASALPSPAAQSPATPPPAGGAAQTAGMPSPVIAPQAPQAAGMPSPTMAGNIDTSKQPIVQNPDGTHSTVSTMGFDIDGKYVNLPTISPDGRRLTPEEAVAEYRRTGRHLGIYNSREEGDAAAQALHEREQVRTEGMPATVNAPAQQPEKPLGREDYVRVVRDGKEMYFPKSSVSSRDTSAVFREMADSIKTLDPEQSSRLMNNALDLETKNIKATADRYGAAVMAARRAYEASPEEGAKALQAAWSLMPNMTDVTVTPAKDGKITVQHFTTHDGKQIAVGGPETMDADKLFRKAASLATPEAMRQYSMDEAAAAQRMFENNLNTEKFQWEKKYQGAQLGMERERLNLERYRATHSGGGEEGKWQFASRPVYNTDGQTVGQEQIRRRGDKVQVYSPQFNGYVSDKYYAAPLFTAMSKWAGQRGWHIAVNDAGDPGYAVPNQKAQGGFEFRPLAEGTVVNYTRK